MKKDIKRFLKGMVIIIITLIVIDIVAGFIGKKLTIEIPGNQSKVSKMNYRMNKTQADVIIIGSSRCQQHYIEEQLEDSIRVNGGSLTVYNAGIDGLMLSNTCIAVRSILDRYRPKMIVIETSDKELNQYADKFYRLMMPFYNINPHVKEYIDKKGWKDRLFAQSSLYKYYGQVLLEFQSAYRHPEISRGFLANKQTMNPNKIRSRNEIGHPDARVIEMLAGTIAECKEKNVKVVVSISPRYKTNEDNPLTEAICKKTGAQLINMEHIEMFDRHYEYFRDVSHLNYKGAPIFTAMFYEYIKPMLQQDK